MAAAPFQGLAKGGNELFDLSSELRIRGDGQDGAAPFISLGPGAYWQVIHEPYRSFRAFSPEDPRKDRVRPGWHVAIGGMAVQGLAPGAEFHFDWIDARPGPTTYFTASFGLHFNR